MTEILTVLPPAVAALAIAVGAALGVYRLVHSGRDAPGE
jgi:hypothetical protein